ncbi:MAG: PASTA domain-containing protein [candidate division Zixibacteria bacterium]|nr:PASTA domain-containing protein [candidate division Zixibacteria bacterium]
MPDLKGKSAREAFTILNNLGLKCSLIGSGSVIRTIPEHGQAVLLGDYVELITRDSKKEDSN